MTAIAEAPKTTIEDEARQMLQEEIDAFVMPRPVCGQSVLWFPTGERAATIKPEVGFILRVGTRNIIVRLASGNAMESVRHISDPKLQLSSEQRENGAWDFTEESKLILDLTKRLAAVEKKLAEKSKV